MKRIIEGKVYNTETAEKMGDAHSTAFPSDFRWWSEELYRTKNGAWFLAGEGHAMSHWAEAAPGGGSGPGRGIRALTDGEAREWAEKYLDAEEYLEIFPAVEA